MIGVIFVPTPLIDTDDDNCAAAGRPAWVRSIYVDSVEVFALPEMVDLGGYILCVILVDSKFAEECLNPVD